MNRKPVKEADPRHPRNPRNPLPGRPGAWDGRPDPGEAYTAPGPDAAPPVERWIRDMPQVEPPASLVMSVMGSIEPKKLSWRRRLSRWARTPRSFSVTPMWAMPAAAVLLALFILPMVWLNQRAPVAPGPVAGNSIPVEFSLALPDAKTVAVIGSFNNWRTNGFEMTRDSASKTWTLSVNLPLGSHEYAFVVDGETIIPDPNALLRQDDGFGAQNSILVIGNQNDTTSI
ncbi:MAG: hypothetical protein GY859_03980 [Desulfobacterales bacterium]|nr:hypothetical protein [Desulfobacterales bacterium]